MASLAVVPVTANAIDEKGAMGTTPNHIQYIVNNKDTARMMVYGTNIAFNCLKSGIGSYINDKGFLGGCTQGVLAGVVMSTGELIASYNSYPMVGAAGKLVYDLGVSMGDNVAHGKKCLASTRLSLDRLL